MKALFGTKIGMTQIIGEDGTTIPVTLIQAGPMTVTQVKSVETDGYNAVQVAYGTGKNLSKAVAGHVKPAGVTPKKIGEIRVDELGEIKVGDTWDVSEFELGDVIDATGMAGHMGAEQVTVKNLKVAYISVENNLIGVKGAVPGPKKGLIKLGGAK